MEACAACGKRDVRLRKCARCRQAAFCSEVCQRRLWPSHRSQCRPPEEHEEAVPVFRLASQAAAFCAHVRRRGFALVQCPGLTRRGVEEAAAWGRRFMRQSFAAKQASGAGPGPGQTHGYMPFEHSEVFEVREHYDQRFQWPDEDMKRSLMQMKSVLSGIALQALRVLAEGDEGMDWEYLERNLLDIGKQGVPLTQSSNSALRLLLYGKAGAQGEHTFSLGNHTDNSFLTVAPRATVPALEILPYDSKDTSADCFFNIEEHMNDDTVCVFVGDSLSYVSRGRYPSVIHRPAEQACLAPFAQLPNGGDDDSRRAVARISMPFFLRGRATAKLGASDDALSVLALEFNLGRCRETWPWKKAKSEYYQLQSFG